MKGFDAFTDLITMRELERLAIVDARRFRSAFATFEANPDADPSSWRALWSAITAEAYVRWFKNFEIALGRQLVVQNYVEQRAMDL